MDLMTQRTSYLYSSSLKLSLFPLINLPLLPSTNLPFLPLTNLPLLPLTNLPPLPSQSVEGVIETEGREISTNLMDTDSVT